MEAIILAGGLGTRLRSAIGNEIPKCMALVGDKPFLWYLLRYLSHYNISRVILSVGYLKEVIFDYIEQHGREFPFELDYAIEEEALGTGGGIKLSMGHIYGHQALILNGDTFFNVDLNVLKRDHNSHSAILTMALKPMENFDRYGNVELDVIKGTILCFREKEPCKNGQINGGIYLLNKIDSMWNGLPQKFSFETEFLQNLNKRGRGELLLYGFKYDDYFIDIGIPADYRRANKELPELFKDKKLY